MTSAHTESEKERVMAKYIKRKHLKNAVEQLPWYHINRQGELVEGAHGHEVALVRYSDVKAIVKGLPTKKIAEQTEFVSTILDTDYDDNRNGYAIVIGGKAEQTEPFTETRIGCSKCESRFKCMDRDTPRAIHCDNFDYSWK